MHDAPAASPAELFHLLLDQGKDYAVILLDAAGVITGWLAGAEYTLGYAAAEVIGKPFSILFTPEDLDRGADLNELAVARGDGRAEDDRWHVRKDGTRIWASGTLTSLRDPAGRVVGFGKVMRDRTDVKAQIDTLANLAQRHKVFLGTLGHELRNALAPLATAVHVLRLTGGAAAPAAPVQLIERQVEFMKRLVDDLMDYTRFGAGKARLQPRPLCLEDLLLRATETCRPQAERRRQELKAILLPTPTVVMADPDRLEQVVVNLLTNAVKYTPEGGGVWVKATVEGNDAVFRVQDNGVGIAPDMLPRIFDLFTQEEASLDHAQGGLGLGLPLVKELVALHGGSVQVRSEGKGKGSEFTVRLPLHRTDAATPVASATSDGM